MRTADVWMPMCMPTLNASGFLHCYVGYLGAASVHVPAPPSAGLAGLLSTAYSFLTGGATSAGAGGRGGDVSLAGGAQATSPSPRMGEAPVAPSAIPLRTADGATLSAGTAEWEKSARLPARHRASMPASTLSGSTAPFRARLAADGDLSSAASDLITDDSRSAASTSTPHGTAADGVTASAALANPAAGSASRAQSARFSSPPLEAAPLPLSRGDGSGGGRQALAAASQDGVRADSIGDPAAGPPISGAQVASPGPGGQAAAGRGVTAGAAVGVTSPLSSAGSAGAGTPSGDAGDPVWRGSVDWRGGGFGVHSGSGITAAEAVSDAGDVPRPPVPSLAGPLEAGALAAPSAAEAAGLVGDVMATGDRARASTLPGGTADGDGVGSGVAPAAVGDDNALTMVALATDDPRAGSGGAVAFATAPPSATEADGAVAHGVGGFADTGVPEFVGDDRLLMEDTESVGDGETAVVEVDTGPAVAEPAATAAPAAPVAASAGPPPYHIDTEAPAVFLVMVSAETAAPHVEALAHRKIAVAGQLHEGSILATVMKTLAVAGSGVGDYAASAYGIAGLQHFVYVWKPWRQYTMARFPRLCEEPVQRKALLRAYSIIYDRLTGAVAPAAPPMRHVISSYSGLEALATIAGLHTTNAIVLCAFDATQPPERIPSLTERLAKLVRRDHDKVLIPSPGVLA